MKIIPGISYREAIGQKVIPAKIAAVVRASEDDYYMVEGCGIWAVDFAQKNGGQIYVLSADYGEQWSDDIPYEVTHAFVEKDGKTVDVRGPRSPEEMAAELNIDSFKIKGPWPPDVFEEKFMGDSDEKPLYGKTAAGKNPYKGMKLYHGSQKKFEPGTILAPQAEGYATSADPMIRQTERIVESQRPKGALPRKNSVFMVHDPDEIDYAGGYTDYVYEVEPIGKVEKNDMGWYSDVSVHWWDKENDPGALKAAKNYWNGKPYGKSGLWEYRAPKAKVVRLVSAEKIAAKQD